jgi:hypothetical protein
MKKSADIIYLTRAEWDAFKEQEHRERVALRRRVERGELTPEQANREASIFAHVPSVAEVPLNFGDILKNARSIRLPRKKNGRRTAKTVHA